MKDTLVSLRYKFISILVICFFSLTTVAGETIPIANWVALPIPTPLFKKKFDSISPPTEETIHKWSDLAGAQYASELLMVERVNEWVNSKIEYKVDDKDTWRSANESLEFRAGDCEDFVLTKMQILENLGIPADRMFFVILYDTISKQHHAILIVKTSNKYFALDNRTDLVIPSNNVRDYTPNFAFSGMSSWTFGRILP